MNKAANEIWSALSNEDYDHVLKQIPRLLASGCQHPRKLSVRDRFYGNAQDMYVPCGKCNQCRNTKGNMLSSRLYLDALHYKHVYLITLHFKAYDRKEDIPESLSGMCWHYDNLCSTGHLAFHPCFLDYGVFQHFFAHLRMNVKRRNVSGSPLNLKYFIGCEYGSKYGRPHAHAIVITDFDLTPADVKKVWKYGSFDFEDLMKNGTMENIGTLSSKKCFKYVAKYANKQDAKFCKDRYNLGLRYLIGEYVKFDLTDDDRNLYYFKPSRYIIKAWRSYYQGMLNALPEEPSSMQSRALSTLRYNYCRFGNDTSRWYGVPCLAGTETYDTWTPDLVYMVFGQRTRLSSGSPIGKGWFEANRSAYVAGLRKLPPTPNPKSAQSVGRSARLHGYTDVSGDHGWQLSWPSQFNTWLHRIQEPYCIIEKNAGGQRSCKKISNFLMQAMADFCTDVHTSFVARDNFVSCAQDFCQQHGTSYIPLEYCVRALPYGPRLGSIADFREDRECAESCLYDYRTGEVLRPYVECDQLGVPVDVVFQRYKYDRASRDYIPTDFTSLDHLFMEMHEGFLAAKADHDKTADDRKAKLIAYDLCFEQPRIIQDEEGNETCYPCPVDFTEDAYRANVYNDACWDLFRGNKSHEQFLKEVDGLESGLDLPEYNTLVTDDTPQNQG